MAKPRPIRLKDAPEVCAQSVVAFWHAVDVARDYWPRSGWDQSRFRWRLPYDYRRAY